MTSRRVVVLISGNGSNLQALLDAVERGSLDAEVVGVISNRPDAYGLQRARRAGIRTEVVEAREGEDRSDYEARLTEVLAPFRPGLVVLAGWMRLFTTGFCTKHKIINLHPAKPGAFPGLRAIQRAYDAWTNGEISESGVMVHWVSDSSVDAGPVIQWRPVRLEAGDTLESFQARVHSVEHELLVSASAEALDSVQTTARRQHIDLAAEDEAPEDPSPQPRSTNEVRHDIPLQ